VHEMMSRQTPEASSEYLEGLLRLAFAHDKLFESNDQPRDYGHWWVSRKKLDEFLDGLQLIVLAEADDATSLSLVRNAFVSQPEGAIELPTHRGSKGLKVMVCRLVRGGRD
jgi:hypothetical protein